MDGELVPWAQATVHASTLGWSTMGAVFEGTRRTGTRRRGSCTAGSSPSTTSGSPCRCASSVCARSSHRSSWWHRASCCGRTNTGEIRTSGRSPGTPMRPGSAIWRRAHRHRHHHGPVHVDLGSGRPCAPARTCGRGWRQPVVAAHQVHLELPKQPDGAPGGNAGRVRPADLLNSQGKVTEGPASCIFMVRDGVAITPSLTSGVLESITRMAVLGCAATSWVFQPRKRSTVPSSTSPRRSSTAVPAPRSCRWAP